MKQWIFHSLGKPVFVLGVQAHNSSAYTAEEMATAWAGCEAMHANTMEVPIYWDKIEPEEGKYDFGMLDYLVKQAREHSKYLVFLWFASWKNGNMKSCPLWVKHDQKRFPRMLNADGAPVASLTPHCEENRNADARAFRRIMAHIREIDAVEQTVLAVQIENEPGYMGAAAYDHGPAGAAFLKTKVPEQVLDFIEKEGQGSEYDCWAKAGKKRGYDWPDTFGKRGYELATAYGVATYLDYIACEGKKEYDIPLYANVWLDRQMWDRPGLDYPAGGGVARNLRLWKSCTPHIDMICPDVYQSPLSVAKSIYDDYDRTDNPLFIPESGSHDANAMSMMRAIAENNLQGIACFGAENFAGPDGLVTASGLPGMMNFKFLTAMVPLIFKYSGTDRMHALYQEEFAHEALLHLRNCECLVTYDSHPASDLGRARNHNVGWYNKEYENNAPRGRGLLVEAEDGTLYVAGAGIRLTLRTEHDEGVPYGPIREERNMNYDCVEEGVFGEDGSFYCKRIRSGDESDYGIFCTPDSGVVKIILGDEC